MSLFAEGLSEVQSCKDMAAAYQQHSDRRIMISLSAPLSLAIVES